VPVLARALRHNSDNSNHSWIIDGSRIPVHDQSITAISQNYRRSVKHPIIICSQRRRVAVVGRCWPDNRNDVIIARHTVTHLLDSRGVLGEGGHRGIASIITHRTTPAATSSTPTTTAIIDHPSPARTHHRPAQRPANPSAMPPPGPSHHRSLQMIARLWNLGIHTQLRVTS
jgi:hypothetical protein